MARVSLPHVSVYINKPVQKEIKRLAIDLDRKTHDLYLEALDLLLTKYGRPRIDAIELNQARAQLLALIQIRKDSLPCLKPKRKRSSRKRKKP